MEESEISSEFSIPKGVIQSEKIKKKEKSLLRSQVELNAVITTANLCELSGKYVRLINYQIHLSTTICPLQSQDNFYCESLM